ncbi:MAG: MFS transporter, partial [Bryobacteraceae bacterium]
MTILAAILAFFVYGMMAAMLGTILPEFSDRFRLTPRQNGIIATMQAVGLIVASFAAGPLIDLEGKKAGLALGLAISAAALFILPRARSYRSVVVYFFLLGVGGGVIVTGANTLASDIPGWNRASALNFLNLFFGVGGLATPFLLGNLLKRNSARLIYIIAALATGTLAIQLATKMPEASGRAAFALSNVDAVFSRPSLILFAAILFLYVGCEVGVWNWLVRHLVAQGVAESRALNILSCGFALGMLT